MVQKKQNTFVEMTEETIQDCLNKLTENIKPIWGNLTPQRMIEHLEYTYKIASGEIQDFEINTPEKYLEKVHATLYNYEKMPRIHDFPLAKQSKIESVKYDGLEMAKTKMLEARQSYLNYFKENPEALTKNVVFGELNRYEWYLLERKHLNHHFEQFGLI